MKYIINVPEDRVRGDRLWILATTEDSLDHYLPTGIKAVPYDDSEAEQRGRGEAWRLAQELENMEIEDWRDCFHSPYADGLTKMSFDEANERYKEWQEQKNEINKIHVGDEVAFENGSRFVVYDILNSGRLCGCGYERCSGRRASWSGVDTEVVRKTGRHFPEIAELLEKMKEPE